MTKYTLLISYFEAEYDSEYCDLGKQISGKIVC